MHTPNYEIRRARNLRDVPNVPEHHRNPYTIWYSYANQNLNQYNLIAIKYTMARLTRPLNIDHTER
jgi:hypothetical protein